MAPDVHPDARVASTANVVGNVRVGAGCYVDHGVLLASSGPPVELEEGVVVVANAVVRSVGGGPRPAFPVRIGPRTLVGPQCALIGCSIGADCYVATGVIVFQGATVGDASRLGAGSIVHGRSELPTTSRVGMRCMAIPREGGTLVTSDVDEARAALGEADFFGEAFGVVEPDQQALHVESIARVRDEMRAWQDEPVQ
jgi:carbonic anhydrase/acetyltransferase-like protein (isoleucine patch superfamily)